ncbi:electron transfer flavoprotein subunit beta/FixA family protein [Salinibaculum salinum]|uniref:electron transfer flavoprotein subunit beta/FixA family protein n=1 Tax=Salinibaculum salinum TaxID=3131996 RepID=UPI0030EEE6BD
MKILVAVKEVAAVDDEFEIDEQSVPSQYLTYEFNEWDDYAVEEAVQISEEHDDVEVVTVTIGPERAEETIRQALAKGADRAIRMWDDTLAERDILGSGLKSRLLAAVVESEQPDLVLTGVQSGDDAFGATGVALARSIDYEWAAVVNTLDIADDFQSASVHRELEGGLEELTDIELPAVLSIQSGINDPRYASLRGIRQAQSKPLDVTSPEDYGLETADLDDSLALQSLYEPVSESDATLFEGDAEETASRLGDLLQDKGVIEA